MKTKKFIYDCKERDVLVIQENDQDIFGFDLNLLPEDVKEKLKKIENFAFKMAEKKSLDSIVVQIVRAIEDKNPKSVYRLEFESDFEK